MSWLAVRSTSSRFYRKMPCNFDINHKALYFGVVVVNSKDTVNKGLKGIIKETNNWIYKFPLPKVEIKGKRIQWIKALKKLEYYKSKKLIQNIELIESDSTNKKGEN